MKLNRGKIRKPCEVQISSKKSTQKSKYEEQNAFMKVRDRAFALEILNASSLRTE